MVNGTCSMMRMLLGTCWHAAHLRRLRSQARCRSRHQWKASQRPRMLAWVPGRRLRHHASLRRARRGAPPVQRPHCKMRWCNHGPAVPARCLPSRGPPRIARRWHCRWSGRRRSRAPQQRSRTAAWVRSASCCWRLAQRQASQCRGHAEGASSMCPLHWMWPRNSTLQQAWAAHGSSDLHQAPSGQ